MIRCRLLLFVSLVCIAGSRPAAGQIPAPQTVVYVVRHAERADDHPTDPTLTPEGTARAELLARMLGETGIRYVHSTMYRRTRLTAAPSATRLGVPVQDYDADEQSALAERIRSARGPHLVVGHSNTVRELVALLGGEPAAPIADAEYDRLYIVTIAADGSVSTSLLRYGSASRSSGSLRALSRRSIFSPAAGST